MNRLTDLAERFDGVTDPRGRGLLCAFDLPSKEVRNRVVQTTYDLGCILLGCGDRSIRFRPALTVTPADLDAGVDLLEQALAKEL